MKFDWIKARQTRYATFATVYIVVVLAILVAVNFLANRYNKSFDSTANKRYSLSPQTQKVVRNLKQDVRIYYFGSPENFGRARVLLDQYSDLSTKLKVQVADPEKEKLLADTLGVRGSGVFVEAGARREEATSLSEEEVTNTLIRVLKTGDRNACFATGFGEQSIDESSESGYSQAKTALEKNNYKVRAISMLEQPEVPKDCTVLIVAGPTKEYVPQAVDAIKTFVENGGRGMFLLNPPLKLQHADFADNTALVNTLASWGVTFNKDLVLDYSRRIIGRGPETVLATNYEPHTIVRDLRGVATIFPISRSLEAKSAANTTVQPLFSSSERTVAVSRLDGPSSQADLEKGKPGPLLLGAAGTFKTPKTGAQGRFVAVGSSDWAGNSNLLAAGNRDLFLNMINWLSSDEDIISIRPRDPENQPLNLGPAQLSGVFYSGVVLLPLLIIVFGVAVWWQRR